MGPFKDKRIMRWKWVAGLGPRSAVWRGIASYSDAEGKRAANIWYVLQQAFQDLAGRPEQFDVCQAEVQRNMARCSGAPSSHHLEYKNVCSRVKNS